MELFRIFKNKKFIAAVITLLLLNCVSFYITQQKSLSDFGINIDAYSATFKDNADIFTEVDKKSIIEKSNKFEILKSFAIIPRIKHSKLKNILICIRNIKIVIIPMKSLRHKLSFILILRISLNIKTIILHNIKSILKNAENLSSKKLFSNKTSYSYKSIQKSANDFSKNKKYQTVFS